MFVCQFDKDEVSLKKSVGEKKEETFVDGKVVKSANTPHTHLHTTTEGTDQLSSAPLTCAILLQQEGV